jgi:hypothetical protein
MPRKMSAEEFARRVSIIRRMTKTGAPRMDIAAAIGISTSAVCQFVNRYIAKDGTAVQDRRDSGRRDFINEQPWQVADPSVLTEDQIRDAWLLGIKPERLAWLLLCPKGGKAHDWRR